ncbi:MAG TPA: GtrA family protein [Firmicutes bacterium]|nr:GtrA family protein [Bacillota bacterium]
MKRKFDWPKYREPVLYLVFGAATTLVNLVLFWGLNFLVGEEAYLITNIIATVLAILFAYVTNKLFVFTSRSWSLAVLKREIPAFFGARAFTFLLEEGGLWLFIDVWGAGNLQISVFSLVISGTMLTKLVLQVIVILLNYVFSKFLIFAKK